MASGSKYWGDLADQAAEGLREEHLKEIEQGTREVNDDVEKVKGLDRRSLFTKLEFKWKDSDRLILDQVRQACNAVTAREYVSLQKALDDLYASIRVPELTPQGNTRLDERGRVVWEKDAKGGYKEDWSSLNGQDLEVAIFHLQKNRIELATRTNELLQEAIFSKHIYNDEYADSYKSLVEGTQGDRNAHANRMSREEKYFAFYKFCLWQSADTLLKEMAGLQRIAERIRDWRIRSQR